MQCGQWSCVPLAGLAACGGSCTGAAGAGEAEEAAARDAPARGDLQRDAGAHATEGAVVEVQPVLVPPPSAQDKLQHQELPAPDMELVVLFVANMWMLRESSWRNCMRVK